MANGADLFSRVDILLGFILGLVATSFTALLGEHLLKGRRKREFRKGMHAELRQILAVILGQMFTLDAKLTKEKLKFIWQAYKDCDLIETALPGKKNSPFEQLINQTHDDEVLAQLAHVANFKHQEKENIHSHVKLIHYPFIENGISSIALLDELEKTILLRIIRNIGVLNEVSSKLNFCFEKSFDSEVSKPNREIIKINYKDNCQFIADTSFTTAKLITELLGQQTIRRSPLPIHRKTPQ